MRIFVLLSASLWLAACTAPQPQVVAETDTKTKCFREYKVGSNIPVMNCSDPASEADRQRLIDEAKRTFRPASPVAPGGG